MMTLKVNTSKLMVNLKKVMESEFGAITISVILGLGLAAIFRSACKDGKCVVIESPPKDELDKYVYKIDSDCYKYTSIAAKCG